MAKNDNIDNPNEWIEEAISKKNIKYYEYKHFSNIKEIGVGSFGKVYSANWKNSEKYLAIKSFLKFNEATTMEIVETLKLQRKADFHNSVIHFLGVTLVENDQNNFSKNYSLVMEYAEDGTLRQYLRKNFDKLTLDNKFDIAYQLACAVSCLHDEGIIHSNLHSNSILVHQNIVKLADFGLSIKTEKETKSQSKLYGTIPYIDPKRLIKREYKLNKMSDVYSIGVLLWEISSGRPPFHNDDEQYDVSLIYEITQGIREKPIPDTSVTYVKLYTDCWNEEPDNRPTMSEVVDRLKDIIFSNGETTKIDQMYEDDLVIINISKPGISSAGGLNKKITNEIYEITEYLNDQLIKHVDELVDLILKEVNEGKELGVTKEHILDYFKNYNINLQEIYDWLLHNQNNTNSKFLLGYFNYRGIGTSKSDWRAFNLFFDASKRDHILAQYHIGLYYETGNEITKDEQFAFSLYENIANKNYAVGEYKIGYFYEKGISVKKDISQAIYWYEKASNNGNSRALYNLAFMYKDGKLVEKNNIKAFELFKKSAEGKYSNGLNMLGCCYEVGIGTRINRKMAFELYQAAADLGNTYGINNLGRCYQDGIGTRIDKYKALELYQKAAKLGNNKAQFNLARKYEIGDGLTKDIKQAIYWYEKSAEQENLNARMKLLKLKEY
ncbi:hypothetical protein RclHR1_00980005 [Rhizophagus clarus]|uniref:Kinase-like domain-containing protein n=1 Tax=Rhizophagus clarus TaxID=94130 RepID=A0A2Z6S5J2_9GLOM|nr:hypothetical protein RclHR1_00980005 [Rhizophagus clarus]GES88065.1 kinase-like domain-containing protein [Rhizophagus clarus]